MQTHSKLIKLAVAAAAMAAALGPLSAFAQIGSSRLQKGTSTPPSYPSFCTRFENASEQLVGRLREKRELVVNRKQERIELFKQKRAERNERIRERRESALKKSDEYFQALQNRAQTEAQKQAVEKFIADVKTAVQTRKQAVDAAVQAFNDGLDQAAKVRQTAMQTAIDNFKKATEDAIAQAKADCAAGVAPVTARENFINNMKTARENFQTARENLQNLQPKLEDLRKTRNEALKKAQQDFKTALQKAKAELKAAFGSSSTSTTTP